MQGQTQLPLHSRPHILGMPHLKSFPLHITRIGHLVVIKGVSENPHLCHSIPPRMLLIRCIDHLVVIKGVFKNSFDHWHLSL
jgi:hypothetical protein